MILFQITEPAIVRHEIRVSVRRDGLYISTQSRGLKAQLGVHLHDHQIVRVQEDAHPALLALRLRSRLRVPQGLFDEQLRDALAAVRGLVVHKGHVPLVLLCVWREGRSVGVGDVICREWGRANARRAADPVARLEGLLLRGEV